MATKGPVAGTVMVVLVVSLSLHLAVPDARNRLLLYIKSAYGRYKRNCHDRALMR